MNFLIHEESFTCLAKVVREAKKAREERRVDEEKLNFATIFVEHQI